MGRGGTARPGRRRSWVTLGATWLAWTCACTERPLKGGSGDAGALPLRVVRATLRQTLGEVLFKREAGDEWSRAPNALELFDNDKVRTARGASAVLQFSNGSVVSLGGDALVGIAETQTRPGRDRTDVTLLRGRLQAELDQPATQAFSVSTPAATVRAGREIVFQ